MTTDPTTQTTNDDKGLLALGERFGNRHLTLPELLVLHRIARNHRHQAIARELNLSETTFVLPAETAGDGPEIVELRGPG